MHNMGLFEWLGRKYGQSLKYTPPAALKRTREIGFYKNCSRSYVDKAESTAPVSLSSTGPTVPPTEYLTGSLERSILHKYSLGSRFTVDVGVDISPRAYSLSCLINVAEKKNITHWCLQVSAVF